MLILFRQSIILARVVSMNSNVCLEWVSSYKSASDTLKLDKAPSVYAPIGSYKDLLPYLVRRLLENGANSSFINRLLDPETDSEWLAENPLIRMKDEKKDIPLPKNIFGKD